MTMGIVGVRLHADGRLVFCRATTPDLASGRAVSLTIDGSTVRATVVIASRQIIAAPPMDNAPEITDVTEIAEVNEVDEAHADAPTLGVASDLVYLPADDAVIGQADVTLALARAAAPIPPAPEGRR